MTTSIETTSLRLPRIFSSGMVIQRDRPSDIWGWATPGAKVDVELPGHKLTATSNDSGRWKVRLPAIPAGGPIQISIKSGEQTLRLDDVLIGDVWLCSGQSNMEWPLSAAFNAEAEIASANDRQLRHFTVERRTAAEDVDDVTGQWSSAEPKLAGSFSAVGYFMARELRKALNVPIGIINSSWGGTTAEAWIPHSTLMKHEVTQPIAERMVPADLMRPAEPYADPGNEGVTLGYADPAHSTSDWEDMDLPRYWETTGMNIDGAVWFRREIDVPQAWVAQGKDLELSLGALDDFDTTYFNGVEIGSTGKETAGWWAAPRRYTVPAKLLKAGRNVISTRIFDQWGNGGFAGKPEELKLTGPTGMIPLAGVWKYKIELELPPAPMAQAAPPTALWHGMIAPLVGLGIRGAAWYQGESNADRAYQYRTLMPALVNQWRAAWGQGDFPFLIVQLANWRTNDGFFMQGEHWAELREAQEHTAKSLPKSAFAVTIDIGNSTDIHPTNKQDVGLRLARAALAIEYGQNTEYRGPTFESARFDGDKAVVNFAHADGLFATGGSPTGFALAGADRIFRPAEATIEGSRVIVRSSKVGHPIAVRYGWADDPQCNVYNKAALPMPPFRSDDWPYLTEKRR